MTAEHPWAMALVLEKRKPKTRNILVGSDRVVIKALEKMFNTTIGPYDSQNPKVFSYVEIESQVPIEEHASSTFFRNPPISKNEALLSYIVSILAPTLKEKQKLVKALMFDPESARDFDVLYWRIMQALTENKSFEWSKQPWESPTEWTKGVELPQRLGRLYADLRAWTYYYGENNVELKSLGLSAGKITYLSNLKLGINKVSESIGILSQWRFNKLTSHQAALMISGIWTNTKEKTYV